MYRLPLGNIEMHFGRHDRRSEATGTYSWKCGCTARRDAKCKGGTLRWFMCGTHFAKE